MAKLNPAILIGVSLALAAASACSEKSSGATAPSSDTTSTVVYNISLDTATLVDSASVEAGSTLPIRVVVTRSGSAAVASTVTWAIANGHGTLSSPTSVTDSLGLASVLWTLGDTVGLNSLTAATGTASVTVRAAGVAGPAAALARISDDSVWVVGGGLTLLTARALDRFGNAVSGAHVTWSATDGQLTRTESITGSSGYAENAFEAPMASSTSIVTATIEKKASIRFRVIALYDAVLGEVFAVRPIEWLPNDDFEDARPRHR